MPKRTDIQSILVIGSGPIVIGQACEFDYSGTQAVRALRSEGYRVILVNSNPATIMTDPELADATYIEPLTPEYLERIVEKERPDAILPTVGGQTGLNLALALADRGILDKWSVKLIGANETSMRLAEDRELFKKAMLEIGAEVPRSGRARSLAEAETIATDLGLPVVIRPSFTLGGSGGGTARTLEELRRVVANGLSESPSREVLIEESVEGWKEFELEVMRDTADNVIIICSIENFDAMGVHTGDSITVAPQMTLSDRQYQAMRDEAKAVIRKVGVDTGGSNIQFAVDPETGRRVVIEMNPRVSRSSALASKATGFPIAKIAGPSRRRLPPGRDPQRHHEEDAGLLRARPRLRRRQDPALDLREVSAGRHAADDPDEVGGGGDGDRPHVRRGPRQGDPLARDRARRVGRRPRAICPGKSCSRSCPSRHGSGSSTCAARSWPGLTVEEIAAQTRIDPWFLDAVRQMVEEESRLSGRRPADLSREELRHAKRLGLSDRAIARVMVCTEEAVRKRRRELGVIPVFKTIDTCAAEFEAGDALLLLDLRGRERVAPHAARRRSSSWAAARTGSGRGSSSTTAASTPATRSRRRATRPS